MIYFFNNRKIFLKSPFYWIIVQLVISSEALKQPVNAPYKIQASFVESKKPLKLCVSLHLYKFWGRKPNLCGLKLPILKVKNSFSTLVTCAKTNQHTVATGSALVLTAKCSPNIPRFYTFCIIHSEDFLENHKYFQLV